MSLFKIFIFIIFNSTPLFLYADQQEVIFGIGSDNNENTLNVSKLLVNEIAKRLDIEVKIVQLPNNQLTWLLTNEKIHAELYRVKDYQKIVPGAILIKEPVFRLPYFAYSPNKDIEINGWDSLLPYKHVTVRGFKFTNTWLARHNTHKLKDMETAFKFLKAKRAEVLVANEVVADSFIVKPEFSNIYKLTPPVDYLTLHTFFAENSPDLAEKYGKALTELHNEGFLEKLSNDLLN